RAAKVSELPRDLQPQKNILSALAVGPFPVPRFGLGVQKYILSFPCASRLQRKYVGQLSGAWYRILAVR
ncbi:hypothetical protein, partial [Hymenobacter sp. BT190]|uniref:hypothetical protein n=1 Tax=Hymenobacter sp. BT190 TaxID=2763505 RepID=UPI001C9DECD9